MSFIGVVCEEKNFDIIKKILKKSKNKNDYKLININRKSLKNLKNVKFEVIVFLEYFNNFELETEEFKEICESANYLVVNSDLDYPNNIGGNIETNIISFGLNHLATVTVSSVTDENVLISIQRSFNNLKGNTIEVGEYNNFIESLFRNHIYEILTCFIISII